MNQMSKSVMIRAMDLVIRSGGVPYIMGSPAMGKSSSISSYADSVNYLLMDIRVAGFEAADINGLPYFTVVSVNGVEVGKRAAFTPNELFKLQGLDTEEEALRKFDSEGNPVINADGEQEYYEGIIYLLDEFASADESVQAACYSLILDRRIGKHKLLDCCDIILAGNLATDGAIANPVGTAIMSRVTLIKYNPTLDDWLDDFGYANIDPRIIAYLRANPDKFNTFKPTSDSPFCAPRTIHRANEIILLSEEDGHGYDDACHIAVEGSIGPTANDLRGFFRYFAELPSPEDILKKPEDVTIPSMVGKKWALSSIITGVLSENLDHANLPKVGKLLESMGGEFVVSTLGTVLKANRSSIKNKTINTLFDKFGGLVSTQIR